MSEDAALLVPAVPTPHAQLMPFCVDAAGLGALLGVSERTVYRLDDAGRIPTAINLRGCKRWFVEEILAWLRAGAPSRRQWQPISGGAA